MSATPYVAKAVTRDLEALGITGIDVRHVEAYMRLAYGTLDAIGPELWRMEVRLAVELIRQDPAGAEDLARSYGL